MTKTIPTQREKSNTILDKWSSSNQSTMLLSFRKISGRGIKQNVFHRQHLILIAFRDPIPFHPTFPQIAFEHLSVAFCGSWSPNSTDLYFWYSFVKRGWKKQIFQRVFSLFCPAFCYFTDNFNIRCHFCTKDLSIQPSLAVGTLVKFHHSATITCISDVVLRTIRCSIKIR